MGLFVLHEQKTGLSRQAPLPVYRQRDSGSPIFWPDPAVQIYFHFKFCTYQVHFLV